MASDDKPQPPTTRTTAAVSRRVIRFATLWVSALFVLQRLAELLKSVFLARWFSKEEMGMVAILLMVHRGIIVFTEMGHDAALVQRADDHLDEAIDTAFVAAVIRGFALATLVALAAAPVARFYDQPALTAFLAASGLLFAVIGFRNMAMVKFTRAVELKQPKLVEAYGAVSDVVVTVGGALATSSIWAVVIGRITGGAVTTISTWIVAPRWPRLRFSKERFMELFRYGRNIQGVAILVFIVTQLDDAVVGRVAGLEQLSVYVIAYTMANLPITNIVAIAGQVAFPAWAAVARSGDIARRDAMFMDTMRFTGALCIALAVALAAGGEELIALIFGDKWREAGAPLSVLVLFGMVRGISANFGALFNSLGRPDLILREIVVKVVVIGALIVPMTQRWGLVGASWAVTAPMLLITPIAARMYLGIAGISAAAALRSLLWPALFGAITWALFSGLQTSAGWLQLAGWLRAVVATLGALALVLGPTWALDSRLRGLVRAKKASEVTG